MRSNGKNCCECLNCKVKNELVRCIEDNWSDMNGGTKFYNEVNCKELHFYNRMYNKSSKLLRYAKRCGKFIDMRD